MESNDKSAANAGEALESLPIENTVIDADGNGECAHKSLVQEGAVCIDTGGDSIAQPASDSTAAQVFSSSGTVVATDIEVENVEGGIIHPSLSEVLPVKASGTPESVKRFVNGVNSSRRRSSPIALAQDQASGGISASPMQPSPTIVTVDGNSKRFLPMQIQSPGSLQVREKNAAMIVITSKISVITCTLFALLTASLIGLQIADMVNDSNKGGDNMYVTDGEDMIIFIFDMVINIVLMVEISITILSEGICNFLCPSKALRPWRSVIGNLFLLLTTMCSLFFSVVDIVFLAAGYEGNVSSEWLILLIKKDHTGFLVFHFTILLCFVFRAYDKVLRMGGCCRFFSPVTRQNSGWDIKFNVDDIDE
jgi:hypothetical protein